MPPRSSSITDGGGSIVCVQHPRALLLDLVSTELSTIQQTPTSEGAATYCRSESSPGLMEPSASFPPACLELLLSIPGNRQCIDCGSPDPQWAAVSYGALVCLQCSGRHRGLGVQVSVVRSLTMDSWTRPQVLSMLEGGNKQLGDFFCRHQLCHNLEAHSELTEECHLKNHKEWDTLLRRYRTNAAVFYRKNLAKHVTLVGACEAYKGREASRRQGTEGGSK